MRDRTEEEQLWGIEVLRERKLWRLVDSGSKILQLDKELPLPKYETSGSAGMDLYAAKDDWITPTNITIIPTGICIICLKDMKLKLDLGLV